MAVSSVPASAVIKKGSSPWQTVGTVLFWVLIAIILVYVLFPFYWAIKTSVTPSGELPQTALSWFPKNPTFENYSYILSNPSFLYSLRNSLFVAVGTVIISLLLSALSSYALGKFRFRGKSALMYVILGVSVFPQIAVLGGMYTTLQRLGLYDTPWGLMLSYMIFTLPFTVWVLTSFVREIPIELEEAALVDGASPLQTLFLVLLPVMLPALATTGLLAFINAWNEYLFALTFTSDDRARTVPVAIGSFSGATQYDNPFAILMAASVTVTIPLIVLVLIFQRNIVSGLTAGAVKG